MSTPGILKRVDSKKPKYGVIKGTETSEKLVKKAEVALGSPLRASVRNHYPKTIAQDRLTNKELKAERTKYFCCLNIPC